jgi:hypothetical protein
MFIEKGDVPEMQLFGLIAPFGKGVAGGFEL